MDVANYDIEAIALQIFMNHNQQFMNVMMVAARLAAMQMMELEDEEFGIEGLDAENMGDWWVPITVLINEYHEFGDPCFRLHFRMSRNVFELFVAAVRNHLVSKGRLQVERTPLQDIMLMVVWLLATPDSFRSVSLRFGVNPGTLYYFYYYIIEALREMAPEYIQWPDAEERIQIKERFLRASGFPGIVGCIDGTHVYITAPQVNAVQYNNRHHSYSINVQAVVDSTLLVRHLHAGEVGSMSDSRVFRRSPLCRDLLTGPPGQFLDVDEHLVGDGGYLLSDFLLIPFQNNGHLRADQLNFNRRLSQSRVRVENAFGRAKGMWRRLKFLHARKQDVVVDHIVASFVLHNFIILNGEAVLTEDELGRPIGANEILGNEDFDEDFEDEQPDIRELMANANDRGVEKRLLYMENLAQ